MIAKKVPLLPAKTLSQSVLVSYFSTSSPSQFQPFQSRRQQQEEDSRSVRVSVWWDFENCNLPAGVNVFRVAQTITAAVRANGMKGPVHITAYGDVFQLSRANQEALSSTGINMAHVPNGGKNSADRSLLVGLMDWVSQNPPPAHLFLISSDRDFASCLHRLRMNNYNILLAAKEGAPSVLCSAASIMWHWNDLLNGENLAGKYFNQPPDGPYGSWYGHYKLPLEDPFSVPEPTPAPVPVPAPAPLPLPPKVEEPVDSIRPIPKAVMKQIRQILCSHPQGITITDLRAELLNSNLAIDKEFYGHKKFSRFLLAMPQVLKLQSKGDGRFLVRAVPGRAHDPSGPLVNTATDILNNVNRVPANSSKMDTDCAAEKNLSPLASSEPNVRAVEVDVDGKVFNFPGSEKVLEKANGQETDKQLSAAKNEEPDVGFFRTLRNIWYGSSEKNTDDSLGKIPTDKLGRDGVDEKNLELPSRKLEASTESPESESDSKLAVSSENLSRSTGLFSRIKNWWKSRGNHVESVHDQPSKVLDQINVDMKDHEFFSKDTFWRVMESFLQTQKGSLAITESRTREELARNLLKEGPLLWKSLKEPDLLLLVDILISQKKWVAECPSESSPFKVILYRDNAARTSSQGSDGLRSLIQKERQQNVSHTGVSPPIAYTKSSERSRSEILMDCRNLVQELAKKYPNGYNMGSFRKLFLERYGYHLDIQKLGYQKLAALLEIMPGVKVESTFIYPSTKTLKSNSDGELSKKENESDSAWDELGPPDVNSSSQRDPDYEPFLSEDDSDDVASDSEPETLATASTCQPEKRRTKSNEDNSSLLDILDTWSGSKNEEIEGNCKKEESERNGEQNAAVGLQQLTGSSGQGGKSAEATAAQMGCSGETVQKSVKTYSFVEDSVSPRDQQHKVIDGILSRLKKTSDSRVPS
ncbi:unnamed protein product [Linum tenue]|uniref:HTH OST-type domain-containing protein n=1 Tax=Linum tenue TaxID=586396 RepID=A0AAV0RCK2_9ROSI|nr:unnamed protein product [Linum tenue]